MVDYSSNPNWIYFGDINAEHGGKWIRDRGEYADIYEITDLDSAMGFDGAVMIERKSVGFYSRSLAENKRRLKSALGSWGLSVSMIPNQIKGRAKQRAVIWEAMSEYGYGDSEVIETLQLRADGPMGFEGWKADRRQPKGDIGGYVMAKYLD